MNTLFLRTSILIGSALLPFTFKPAPVAPAPGDAIRPLDLRSVHIRDDFWSPRLKTWQTVTANDVLDKLEGRYEPDREDLIKEKAELGTTRDAFRNFDRVAAGEKNTGHSDGPPWYDGLVYETIRGTSDLLVAHPDAALEKRLDGYIRRIGAAQDADPDGYINTYTTLNSPDKRWGLHGGNDRWQHDVYNAGMLVEAGVHHYRATGKTTLLTIAVKMANYMCRVMGDAPKLNIIPAHAGPEEAFLKLYQLFKQEPALKKRMPQAVHERDYYTLVRYWIDKRGVYADAGGGRRRHSDSSYNQDHLPVIAQQRFEGHAVRATLLGTGVAAMALEDGDAAYRATADRYWNNMVGKRTFITGGQGAIAEDEKFGPDYFLPESAYLETCASVGSAFFSERMNELFADGRYMDEFERVIYNNMLSAVAEDGRHYHYENPLKAGDHKRWAWHSCPCCPPMFLKMIGALPAYIYSSGAKGLYVNLFIGSTAETRLGAGRVMISQQTGYPFTGGTQISIDPDKPAAFTLHIRVPGWAQGRENPFGLYSSATSAPVRIRVNGEAVPLTIEKGYAKLRRTWKKGDRVALDFSVAPRIVRARNEVKDLQGKFAIAAGPLVFAVENRTGKTPNAYTPGAPLQATVPPGKTMPVISSASGDLRAIPFYAIGNTGSFPYQVWLPQR